MKEEVADPASIYDRGYGLASIIIRVSRVGSLGSALVVGLIAGVVIGAAQWFTLRRWISWLWIAATSNGQSHQQAVTLRLGPRLISMRTTGSRVRRFCTFLSALCLFVVP